MVAETREGARGMQFSGGSDDERPPQLIREHYEIEKELADQLRLAGPEDRRRLYSSLYDQLFRRVPHHPQLTHEQDEEAANLEVQRKMRLIGRFLRPSTVYLEVGPGDCRLALEVARQVEKVYGIEVSAEITKRATLPPNFELIISDGCSIPVPAGRVDVAYSHQLMEHLHPDDAVAQLEGIFRCLMPAGVYVCITPSKLSGPHDVSRYFDDVATGFHLREYSNIDLAGVMKQAGFTKLRPYVGGRGLYWPFPLHALFALEKVLGWLPRSWAKRVAQSLPGRCLLGVVLVARKPA